VGGPGLNTFYFEKAALAGADEALLCHNRVRTAMFDGRTLFPTSWVCRVSSQVDVIDDVNGNLVDAFSVAQSADVAGFSASGYGPTPLMFLLQFGTANFVDGQAIRGRAYIGPTIVQSDADGTPSIGGIDAVKAIGLALRDLGNPANPRLKVWRRPRAADATRKTVSARTQRAGSSWDVTSHNVPNKWAILKSRRD